MCYYCRMRGILQIIALIVLVILAILALAAAKTFAPKQPLGTPAALNNSAQMVVPTSQINF